MQRIPEPELMDDSEQARVYAEADFSASDLAMVRRLDELFGAEGLGPRIVDLGCGPGTITFLVADHFPRAAVRGIDGAAAMLAIAEERRTAVPRWRERVRFQRLVLPMASGQDAASPLARSFSAVVSNSLLHHLHDPGVLWRSVRTLAAPGAALYLRDLRRPPTPTELQALVELHAGAAHPLLRRDYTRSLHAAFTPEEVEEQLAQAGLADLKVAAVEDRYLEVWGRMA